MSSQQRPSPKRTPPALFRATAEGRIRTLLCPICNMASSRNAKVIRTVDDVDLPRDGKSNLRAILLPMSESAIYSTSLEANGGVACSIKSSIPLLSPCASSSEDEGGTVLTETISKGRTHTRRNRSQATILLEQSADQERFTLGASLDNKVVLKHPLSADEERCYINLLHAQLYPDPDQDSLILFNSSTSAFNVQPLGIPQVVNDIRPGEEARLECGSWQLNFGEGLDFEIRIMPWAAREVHRDWSLISPTSATSSLPAKLPGEAAAITPTNDKAYQSPLLGNTKSGPASTTKKAVGSSRARDRAILRPWPYHTKLSLPHTSDILYYNDHSLVFKAMRNSDTVAVKVFRHPKRVKVAADRWRNELNILNDLKHPSIIKLREYDARTLCIELEYVGQDLSKFVDGRRMSQLSEAIGFQIWNDISSAGKYLHDKEIVHLDIKDKNILLDEHGRAKLCDFELSMQHMVSPVAHNGGTPRYIPPEFIQSGERGRPDDVWGFAIVMMFVFSITPRVSGGKWMIANIRNPDDKGETVAKMLEWLDEVEQSKKRIPDKYSLLLKMLDVNPRKRSTFSELVRDLRALPQVIALNRELLA